MPYLPALTESVLSQTYSNLEVVFSEGGGSDDSIDFLKRQNDPRIRIIQMPEGTGAAANWTAVSRVATGEFTKLICQDDLLYPDAISQQVADLTAHPKAVLAVAQRDIIDAHGNRRYSKRGLAGVDPGLIRGDDMLKQCYLRGTNILGEPLTVLFRTNNLKAALPWLDENPLMLDLTMYSKVASESDLVARLESVGAFRVSGASWSTKMARNQREQTKSWQESYATTAENPPTSIERLQAATGRTLQVNLRRVAYAVLRARGALN
jgi:glycosyltransferase involved in cell wall biosynthesis